MIDERFKPFQEEKDEEYYDEAMANAERELAEDAEWKRIQENSFTCAEFSQRVQKKRWRK